MISTEGPSFTTADINNDGLDDFYLGGSVHHTGSIYIQNKAETFTRHQKDLFSQDSLSDDVDAVFFDFDNDNDLDLYVVSGGSESTSSGFSLLDRLYENIGTKNRMPIFKKTDGKLPASYQAGSCVRPADIDNDGDLDLFIGTRLIPSYYGLPSDQLLLLNDGHGNFSDVTSSFAPQFKKLGLVTDAQWFDYDDNGFLDLIVVGEWMPVTLFTNNGRNLIKMEDTPGLQKSDGWWNRIVSSDLDSDGDMDFVLGNLGQNSKFKPTPSSPISLYVNDFDQNGSIEPIFAFQKNGTDYPMALRPDLIKQMSSLKKKFIYYKDYAGKSIGEIFDSEIIEKSTKLHFYEPNTLVLINQKESGFERRVLPFQAQFSPVYGIGVEDINKDSIMDIVLGGNLFSTKPEVGKYDALYGLALLGDGKGNFSPLSSQESGLKLHGQVRHIGSIRTETGKLIAFVRNNDSVKFYKVK